MANWFFLALAAVLIAIACAFWNHFESVAWFLVTVAVVVLAFALFAPHPRKAAVLDVVVTLVMALGFLV